MSEKPIIPILKSTLEWNIAMVKDILAHPENWGSGTKEDWEENLRKLEAQLEEAKKNEPSP